MEFFATFASGRHIIMMEKNFKYYLDHQGELLPRYNGQVVMIVDEKVVGAYATEPEAYYAGKQKYCLGNFLIQLCTPGENAYTITIKQHL